MYASENIWRDGNLLVMRRDAELPDRCIKTNKPANGKQFKVTLSWHHPAIYLLIFWNPIIYMGVAFSVCKKANVYIGVKNEILHKRKRAIWGSWVVGLTGVVLCFLASLEQLDRVFIPLGCVLILVGLIWQVSKVNLIRASRIEDRYIWIRGVADNYLALLPEWNPESRMEQVKPNVDGVSSNQIIVNIPTVQPLIPKKIKIGLLIGLGCCWAFLTGLFFAAPGLSSGVGFIGILIALVYSGAICLWGRSAIWPAIGLAAVMPIAYVIVTETDFSIINYAVSTNISINFCIFGPFGVSLRETMPLWRSWFITAGTFGGSLGLGWLVGWIGLGV